MFVKELSWQKRIYDTLPASVQNVAVSCLGALRWRLRYGGEFKSILREMLCRDDWSEEQITAYKLRRLLGFVQHAARTVPFYKKRFKELGINAEDIRSFEDYSRLPILTKEDLQANMSELFSDDYINESLVKISSSGSTGRGIKFATTAAGFKEFFAVRWRHFIRHGIPWNTWQGVFSGNLIVPVTRKKPPFWRVNYPGHTIFFSIFHLEKENLLYYLREISRRKLQWLNGQSSAISILAQAALDTGWQPPPTLKWITTDSEHLLDWQKRTIEKGFQAKVVEIFGLCEAAANFSECPSGNLHVDEDFAYVEFVPDPEIEGLLQIVGTNFSNPAFPLLRYEVGDFASLSSSGCGCGLPGRIVANVEGRLDDYVLTPGGKKIARLHYIFKSAMHVREAQIRQVIPEEIEILIAVRNGYNPAEEKEILNLARAYIGPEVKMTIRYVDRVPRTSRGKIRFVVSELEQGIIHNVNTDGLAGRGS